MPFQYHSGQIKPRRLSVPHFRAELDAILTYEEEVVITNKGKVVGTFHPVDLKQLECYQWRGVTLEDFLLNMDQLLFHDSDQSSIIILQEGLLGGYFMFRRERQPRLLDRVLSDEVRWS